MLCPSVRLYRRVGSWCPICSSLASAYGPRPIRPILPVPGARLVTLHVRAGSIRQAMAPDTGISQSGRLASGCTALGGHDAVQMRSQCGANRGGIGTKRLNSASGHRPQERHDGGRQAGLPAPCAWETAKSVSMSPEQMDNLIPHCDVKNDEEDDSTGDLGSDDLNLHAKLTEPFHVAHHTAIQNGLLSAMRNLTNYLSNPSHKPLVNAMHVLWKTRTKCNFL